MGESWFPHCWKVCIYNQRISLIYFSDFVFSAANLPGFTFVYVIYHSVYYMLAASEHSHIHTSKMDRQALHWTWAELSPDGPESISRVTWWLLFKHTHAVYSSTSFLSFCLCASNMLYIVNMSVPTTIRICDNWFLIFSAWQMWKIKAFLAVFKRNISPLYFFTYSMQVTWTFQK